MDKTTSGVLLISYLLVMLGILTVVVPLGRVRLRETKALAIEALATLVGLIISVVLVALVIHYNITF